jgi:hypothetical protein
MKIDTAIPFGYRVTGANQFPASASKQFYIELETDATLAGCGKEVTGWTYAWTYSGTYPASTGN